MRGPGERYTLELLTRDQLLADLRRALEACFPDDADARLRTLERRLDGVPALPGEPPSESLLVDIADAVAVAFPARADDILRKLQRVLEAHGDRGDVTVVEPRTIMAVATDPRIRLDEIVPSLVILAPLGHPAFGQSFLLDRKRLLAGRAPGCELILAETSVSRRHFELDLTRDSEVLITDLRSLNGTFVNGRKLEPLTDTPLTPRDSVACGRMVMKFFDPRRQSVRRL